MKETNRGFIALIAAVLISTVLLGLSSTIGVVSWYARLGVKESEDHRLASLLAESCVDTAFLRLAEKYQYNQAAGEIISVGDASCKLVSIIFGTEQNQRLPATITTHARVGASVATLVVVASVINPSVEPSFGEHKIEIDSWQEI